MIESIAIIFSSGIPPYWAANPMLVSMLPKKSPIDTAYKLPAIMLANHAIQPLMNAFGLGSPSFTHLYPPPASGNAEPSSAYVRAVKKLIHRLQERLSKETGLPHALLGLLG